MKKELIESIEEIENVDGQDGYKISTNIRDIYVMIDNGQSCCELWGYCCSDDDTTRFIGAVLLDIKIVDEALNVKTAEEIYEGGVMFVNFETKAGTFQIKLYNEHNGYYGHSAIIYYTPKEKTRVVIMETVL